MENAFAMMVHMKSAMNVEHVPRPQPTIAFQKLAILQSHANKIKCLLMDFALVLDHM